MRALVEGENRAYLQELGINALELLPPADSFVDREWGYATSSYFAADYDLGFPKGHLLTHRDHRLSPADQDLP